ncbi:MAG: pyridoxal phosphate-dependent aminotransferase [Xanthobacteraceae bacterium]|jgi:aspartate/methionine/tyrosine aminotransferase|nr:pyridoxal phosphate-dependent aminotransferase [Xanthobacteraceae bacterium]
MDKVESKFASLETDSAPGQEVRSRVAALSAFRGDLLPGPEVDFSHGDVDAFLPAPGALEAFLGGVRAGGKQAYTEYRGSAGIRTGLAARLADFTGAPVSADNGLILTPGSQGALFLAMASTVAAGDKVAVVQPDYFANRKLVRFLEGEIMPVRLAFLEAGGSAGLDLGDLEDAFRKGAKVFVFSNPNNPTGVVYSEGEIRAIADLAERYGATVIVDQLYSRLRYQGTTYTHLRAADIDPNRVLTIMGPSKTESLSGYRLGVAFGSPRIVERMERLQAIVSLRAAGYNQSVLATWLAEPNDWMAERIALHQAIRNDLLAKLKTVDGMAVRTPEAGSYLFPKLPPLSIDTADFIKALRFQASVVATPGSEFGPDSGSFVRLNFSQKHAEAIAAVDRMATLIKRYGN